MEVKYDRHHNFSSAVWNSMCLLCVLLCKVLLTLRLQAASVWSPGKIFILWPLSVETVVLSHEEDVEHHGENTQTELGGIAKYKHPLVWGEKHSCQSHDHYAGHYYQQTTSIFHLILKLYKRYELMFKGVSTSFHSYLRECLWGHNDWKPGFILTNNVFAYFFLGWQISFTLKERLHFCLFKKQLLGISLTIMNKTNIIKIRSSVNILVSSRCSEIIQSSPFLT